MIISTTVLDLAYELRLNRSSKKAVLELISAIDTNKATEIVLYHSNLLFYFIRLCKTKRKMIMMTDGKILKVSATKS